MVMNYFYCRIIIIIIISQKYSSPSIHFSLWLWLFSKIFLFICAPPEKGQIISGFQAEKCRLPAAHLLSISDRGTSYTLDKAFSIFCCCALLCRLLSSLCGDIQSQNEKWMKIFDFSALVFMLLFLSLKLQFCLLCFQNTVLLNVLGVMPAF